ncbi:MAG TPA: hypothetical protein VGB45_06055 [Abditibacterium sp.]|jgi:hypothetical protein
MKQTAIRLDIDRVISAAREAGATDGVCEGLRQRLEVLNAPPGNLADLSSTHALKFLSRQLGGIFDDPDASEEARAVMIQSTRRTLDESTDFPLAVMLGQWKRAAQFIESLMLRPTPDCALDERQVSTNCQIALLAETMAQMPEHFPNKTAQFAPAYNAHRMACVLACPFQDNGDCAQNFDCRETRWGFCRMDLGIK